MSKISEALALLGLKPNEKFINSGKIYFFDDKGVLWRNDKDTKVEITAPDLRLALCGEFKIEKLPFKPSEGDNYYYVDEKGYIYECRWTDDDIDYYRYNARNCFKVYGEISQEDVNHIVKDMKEKYEAAA